MKAEILSVGTELTQGQITDTNAGYIAQHLSREGIDVTRHTTVSDEEEAILGALGEAASRADVVILTGGIGPTTDDRTRETVAQFCGVALRADAEALAHIEALFRARGRRMTPNNRKQALIPAGAEVIRNPLGTAAGFFVRHNSSLLVSLPGVPKEMKRMFTDSVLPRLRDKGAGQRVGRTRLLRSFGLSESAIDERIAPLMAPHRNPSVGTMAQEGVISIRIHAQAQSEPEAMCMLDEAEREIREKLGEIIFGRDEQTLASAVSALLEAEGATLAVAESCTGGLVAHWLTDVPGISRFFREGLVTYSNESKIERLGVPAELIQACGAVSPEVAKAMAEGVHRRARTDYGLGLTGIAGPGGGTERKPVGLVFIALAGPKGPTAVEECRWTGPRDYVKDRSAKTALNMLRLELLRDT